MHYETIDSIKGYTLEPGDLINYDGDLWQILPGEVDDSDPNVLVFKAHNLDTGDEDEIPVEPEDYYDLMEA